MNSLMRVAIMPTIIQYNRNLCGQCIGGINPRALLRYTLHHPENDDDDTNPTIDHIFFRKNIIAPCLKYAG